VADARARTCAVCGVLAHTLTHVPCVVTLHWMVRALQGVPCALLHKWLVTHLDVSCQSHAGSWAAAAVLPVRRAAPGQLLP
jgi:hypothetical protein